jgi:hypothetical protein
VAAAGQRASEWANDPQVYVSGFDAYLDAYVSTEEEADAVGWLSRSLTGPDEDDGVFRLIGLGYIVGSYEDWSEDALSESVGLFSNFRQKMEREYEANGVHPDAYDLVYGSNILSIRISEFAVEGDDTLLTRVDAGFERHAAPLLVGPLSDDELLAYRTMYDLGIGLRLFFLWSARMDELGFDAESRWADLEIASELVGGDRLTEAEFPLRINGCVVDLADTLGYEIRSDGPAGGQHVTRFLAEGEEANILSAQKSGRLLGSREVDVPLPRHVDVLRAFGFTLMSFPNGKRYELRNWPGVRRIE